MPKAKQTLIIAIFILSIIASFFVIAEEQQDFGTTQEDISFSNNSPTEGENITISVNVHYYNISTTAFANLTVYVDEINNSNIIGYNYFSVPSGNGTKLISFYWNTSSQAGNHTIIAKLHRFNFGGEITDEDANTSNNIATKNITVKKRADLTLTKEDITFSKNPANESDIIQIKAKIRNVGETNANNFFVAFYNNTISNESMIGLAIISVNANSFSFAQINYDTTNQYGNHRIIVFADYLNQTNETNEDNNTAQNELRVRNYGKDMIVNGSKIWSAPKEVWIHTGFIYVQDNGVLELPNTIFNIKQYWENQFDIILEDNGKLLLSNATIKDYYDLYSFNIYFFNQNELSGNKATIKANITGNSSAKLSLTKSIIQGNLNLTCNEFSLFYCSVQTNVFNLSANKISINDTVLNAGNDFYINPIVNFYSTNSSFNKPLDDFKGNSVSYLLNTTISAEEQKQIIAKENALVWRYWYFTVEVRDDAFLPIKSAKVSILYYPKPFLIETIYKTDYTDKEGKITFILESDEYTYQGQNFLGNYNLTVEYKNLKIFKRGTPPLQNNIFVNIELNETLINPEDVYEKGKDIILKDEEKPIVDFPFTHQGNIILQDNSTLLIKNLFRIEQTKNYQYFILLKDNSSLILDNGKIESSYSIILYLYDNSTLILKNNSSLNTTIIARFNSKIFMDKVLFENQINTKCDFISISNTTLKGNLTLKTNYIEFYSTNINSSILTIVSNKIEIIKTNISINVFSFKTNIFNSVDSIFNKQLLFSGNTIANLINTTALISVEDNAVVYIYWYLILTVKDNIGNKIPNATVHIYSFEALSEKLNQTGKTNFEGVVFLPLLVKTITNERIYFSQNYKAIAFYGNYTTDKINIIMLEENLIKEIKFNETLSPPTSIIITIEFSNIEVFLGEQIKISGVVKFANGVPIENADVNLYINDKIETTTKTNVNGYYEFNIQMNKGGDIKIKVEVKKELNIFGNISTYTNSTERFIKVKEKPTPPAPINWFAIIISLAVIITTIGVISYHFRERIKVFFYIFYVRFIKRQEMAECGECAKLIPTTANKCVYCGAEFERELIKCSKCEAMIPVSAEKCEFCGAEFTKKEEVK